MPLCQCPRLRLRGLEMRSVSDALRCAQEQPEKRGEAESGSGRPGGREQPIVVKRGLQ